MEINTTLHESNEKKWDSLVLSWGGFWMIWKCHDIPYFHVSFLFKNSGKREQVDENDFRHCYGKFFFFESVIPKVLDHSYYNPPWQQHLKDTLQLRILWTWSTWTLRTWSLYQDIWLCVCSSFSQTSLVFKFNLLLIK